MEENVLDDHIEGMASQKEEPINDKVNRLQKELNIVHKTISLQNKVLAHVIDRLEYLEGRATPEEMKKILLEIFEENQAQ